VNDISSIPLAPTLPLLRQMIRDARADATREGKRFIECLEQRTGLDSADFTACLAQATAYPLLAIETMHDLAPAFDLLPYAEALQHECVLFRTGTGEYLLAFSDPFDETLRAWAGERICASFSWHLAHSSDLTACLARQEDGIRAMDAVRVDEGKSKGSADLAENLSIKSISEDTSPVVKLVNSTLYDALKSGASDIHLETTQSAMVIKYRIDGVLTTVGTSAGDFAEQVISRVKIMSELDIAERRIPQDGRFKIAAFGREIDFRVSIIPSIFGEDAVLRILDKQQLSEQSQGLKLEILGFDGDMLEVLRRLSREPYGMVLVTGPTGSGKTTTLYAAVSEINTGRDKIITIEDPVEYQLPGVLQIPVNEKKGLTFALGLRSVLRHDPDKILVGEIRDPETAQIAVQAALTGHLVFTTVHANNVFDVIGRFMQMGVDPYSFVAALNGVVAQRLVRLTCRHCAAPNVPDQTLLRESGIAAEQASGFDFRTGAGCGQCRGTGYKGRKAIAEYLVLNDEMRELILAREPIRRIKQVARESGTRFLREAALDTVRRGETDLKEINRVTFAA
jgi:general secretion pathway protein E